MKLPKLLLIASLLLVSAIAICCGGGLLLVGVGEYAIASDVAEQIQLAPEVQEHLGQIEGLNPNWSESFSEPEPNDASSMVYEAKGTLATGQIRAEYIMDDDSHATVIRADLVLDDGTVLPLTLPSR